MFRKCMTIKRLLEAIDSGEWEVTPPFPESWAYGNCGQIRNTITGKEYVLEHVSLDRYDIILGE